MKLLLQRVSQASVTVSGKVAGEINQGLLVLIGIDKQDSHAEADRLLNKLIQYRVFADEQGKMNCSVQDIQGSILLVSQFTLSANTQKGLRPSFSSAAAPADAEKKYLYCLEKLKKKLGASQVQAGIFGADMQVSLTNDGPVTFLLE